ncbi:MAG: HEAT repeat domain-containing protein [Simkaniaceae bacterium]|nr:HEAT repeat domain-containing protein [Simkaniaceae bacterium]
MSIPRAIKWLICTQMSLVLPVVSDEADSINRVSMFFKLKDFSSAKMSCLQSLEKYPDSDKLKELNFRVSAESGQIKEAMSLIKNYPCFQHIDNYNDLSLVEALAWGVLSNVSQNSESMQLMSLIGAFFTRDARAVELILKHLRSENALLRAHAIHAVTSYRDDILKDELKTQFEREKNYFVKLDIIRAIGALQMKECRGQLKEIISSERSTDEEKFYAIASLIEMYEKLDQAEFQEMIQSSRSGLRRTACQAAAHFDFKEGVLQIFDLLNDISPDVKISALNALAMLGVDPIDPILLKNKIAQLIEDSNATISLTAEWLKVRLGLDINATAFLNWLNHEHPRTRIIAASALAMYGKSMQSEMLIQVRKHADPFVRLNLAMGLIRTNTHVSLALKEIHDVLLNAEVRLMKTTTPNPFFSAIVPSEVRHVPFIPQYPEVIDQLVRLEMLNILTMFDYKDAKKMLKQLIQNQSWTVIGTTASILLEQGELDGIDLVKELLSDTDPAVVTQAALVLAYLAKDPSVVPILEKTYEKANWELKIQILEALGRIGEKEAIPFLIRTIDEPFQLLKIIAASSLIQCLYH